jgi:hypothetical protein
MVKTLSLEQLRKLMLDSEEARQAYEDFDKELAHHRKILCNERARRPVSACFGCADGDKSICNSSPRKKTHFSKPENFR